MDFYWPGLTIKKKHRTVAMINCFFSFLFCASFRCEVFDGFVVANRHGESSFYIWKVEKKKNGGNFLKKLHISIIIDDVIQFIKGVFANSDIHWKCQFMLQPWICMEDVPIIIEWMKELSLFLKCWSFKLNSSNWFAFFLQNNVPRACMLEAGSLNTHNINNAWYDFESVLENLKQ